MLGARELLSKDHRFGEKKVQNTRDAECYEVANDHIPTENLLEKEQKEHLYPKTCKG